MVKGVRQGETLKVCNHILIGGIVQGVGFRPFVYNLAAKYGLRGWVRNSPAGVEMDVEGDPGTLDDFCRELQHNPPRLARIESFRRTKVPPRGYQSFKIVESERAKTRQVLVPPDVAACAECLQEVGDPSDRRYLYPFTNCTNCGPRFTIIEGIPYDRERTAMKVFAMCHECLSEYESPADRRFHAQPNACPRCGPEVTLVDREGVRVKGSWVEVLTSLILEGKIVAVKGLGGFHLACDARSEEAVEKLRRRKHRPDKPLAVMCRDLAAAKKYCQVDKRELEALTSPEAPIVILARKEGERLARGLAPKMKTLGVMLPYTPLHSLLFDDRLEVLVMTSGNRSELPLAASNQEALEDLGEIADYFLLHNRRIVNRCDDSVVRVVGGEVHPVRRSRGYVPRPVPVPNFAKGSGFCVLGTGGEMKNTFCLLKGSEAFLGPHIGEVGYEETLAHYRSALERLTNLLEAEPSVVAHDLHPGYRLTRIAGELGQGKETRTVGVQHHHAHLASCMGENGLVGEVIGVICDGTGYGTDGKLWGMEILSGGYASFRRHYHLAYTPMPGGEAAVRNPWRLAVGFLGHHFGSEGFMLAREVFPKRRKEIEFLRRQMETGLNCPDTSGCGRLFDAVSAILGLCEVATYEGQAAVELGELVLDLEGDGVVYPFHLGKGTIDPTGLLRGVVEDYLDGVDPALVAFRFHATVARMLAEAALETRKETGLDTVVLSGGVFQNPVLFSGLKQHLEEAGMEVYYHRLVPANDGGLALGQALVGRAKVGGD